MTARLRLLLAILVLALAPVMAPAALPAVAAVTAADGCDHGLPCGDMARHGGTADCTAACLSHGMMPPLVLAGPVIVAPAARALRQPLPRSLTRSAALWPPPVRPPRS